MLLIGSPLDFKAQQAISEDLITVTITHEDGTVTVLKKRGGTREEVEDMMSSFGQLDGSRIQTVEVAKGDPQDRNVKIFSGGAEGGNRLIYIRKAGSAGEDIEIDLEGVDPELDIEEEEVRIRIREARERVREIKEHRAASHRENDDYIYENGAPKPFMGVYLGGARSQGVRISGVVRGSGAEKAGLEDEDIITSIDGISLAGEGSLGKALYQFEPGQSVTVGYMRDGQPGYTEVTLTAKGYRYSAHYEEDPCQVFIGIYTATHHEGGVDVRGVINSTPAFRSGVQPGDRILALDGVQVANHRELKVERDKHELGDYFTLDIERGDQFLQIEAQFPSCEEIREQEEEEAPEAIEEVIVKEEPPSRSAPELLEEQQIGELQLLDYQVFPNPTVNYVNVRFQGEAKPMTLQLVNNAGQVVFEDVQNRFDGIYNKRLNLEGITTGTYYIRVIQEDKVKTEPLVVVPRV